MNNYQLYRTNLYLGGQMKWDIVVDSSRNQLCVSDFHLSPISDNIQFTTDTTSIVYSHQYNVKTYYDSIRDNFYTAGLDSKFNNTWPIICEANEVVDAYSNVFDMGCKRTKQYSRYNKQFEFFCPLWLEHINGDISFKIYIKDSATGETIASKTLALVLNHNNGYHDKFITYFKNYVSYSTLDAGNDNLMNIDFKNRHASITGLNISTGLNTTRNVSGLISDLTSIERPIMEFDYLLMNEFISHNMISNQLFNFNLCFNIEDILSGSVTDLMYGNNVIISVDAFVNNVLLEKRDFYTEYEYIAKDTNDNQSYNVLDYLQDYNSVNLVDKNKFDQNICHWSLNDNNEYIFNLYNGFSGYNIESIDGSTIIYENTHSYGRTPNIELMKYNKAQNSTDWFTSRHITKWSEFYKYVNNFNKYKLEGTFIGNTGTNFINGIKYSYIPDLNVYILGLSMSLKLLSTVKEVQPCIKISETHEIYALFVHDLIIFITTDMNMLTFKNMKLLLSNNTNETLNELGTMLNSAVQPIAIHIDNTILYNTCASPNVNSREIAYYKENDSEYVIRYDGKIKPSFVTSNNTLYYKDYASEQKLIDTQYTSYDNNTYEPVYPSIDYCAIKKLSNWSYSSTPNIKVIEHVGPVSIYSNATEYSWFNTSKCLVISPILNINGTTTKTNGEFESIDSIIREYISETYNLNDENMIDYVSKLYSYKITWDYLSITNVDTIKYNITLELK